jgi:hypothetical protein
MMIRPTNRTKYGRCAQKRPKLEIDLIELKINKSILPEKYSFKKSFSTFSNIRKESR